MVRRSAWVVVVAALVAGPPEIWAAGTSSGAWVDADRANPPESERIVLRMSSGATWRGWVGEQVEIEFEEVGVVQRGRGVLRAASPQFIQVDMLIGSSRALRTVLVSSLRAMRTLDSGEREAPEALLPQAELDPLRWIVEDGHELSLVRLSEGVDGCVEQLGELEPGAMAVMLVDVETLDAAGTSALLAAVDAARRRGAYLVGLGGTVSDGAAVVVLACEVSMLLERSTLSAAPAGWAVESDDPGRIAADAAKISGHGRSLFDALLGGNGDLSWSSERGFEGNQRGQRRLNRAGAPLRIPANEALRIGIVVRLVPNAQEAVRLVATGELDESAAAEALAARRAGEARRVVNPAAIAAAIDANNGALAALKRDIAEFNLYFTGRKGRWTGAPNLRAVWERTGEMTIHVDTVTATGRLQRSMRESINTMRISGRRLLFMIEDRDHVVLVRHRALMQTADLLQAAIVRNRSGDYMSSSSAMLRHQPLPAFRR